MKQGKVLLSLLILNILLALIPLNASQTTSLVWKESLAEDFTAELSVSNLSPSISDTITLDLKLTYPKSFKPQIDILRKNLLLSYQFTESPFALVREITNLPLEATKDLMQQHVIFLLSPQLSGSHVLTLREIVFQSLEEKDRTKKILTPIFKIDVQTPNIDFQPLTLISPLMPLTKKIPITSSLTNHKTYIHNKKLAEQAAYEGMQAIHQKQFPWIAIVLTIVSGILWAIIKSSPKPVTSKKHNTFNSNSLPPDKIALQSINQISTTDNDNKYFHTLDKIVRSYLKKRYHIDIFSYTTQELKRKLEGEQTISDSSKKSLTMFFEENDQKKFSNNIPSLQECEATKDEASILIQSLEKNT